MFAQSFLPQLSSFVCNRLAVRYFDRFAKRTNPSADRNSPAIADALQDQLDRKDRSLLLEIASGTGQHAGFLAPLFPNVIFQTSEADPQNLSSMRAYAADCATKNIRDPILIDITVHPKDWQTKFEPNSVDYMLNINMVHISPFNAAVGLFKAAGYLLKPQGKLFTYGPYAVDGKLTPESNIMFDQSLKSRNPEWGIRDIVDLQRLAKDNGLALTHKVEMPANNKTLTWTKI